VPFFKKITASHFSDLTFQQVKNQWYSLRRKYEKVKSANNKSGHGASTFEFYELMDEFLAHQEKMLMLEFPCY